MGYQSSYYGGKMNFFTKTKKLIFICLVFSLLIAYKIYDINNKTISSLIEKPDNHSACLIVYDEFTYSKNLYVEYPMTNDLYNFFSEIKITYFGRYSSYVEVNGDFTIYRFLWGENNKEIANFFINDQFIFSKHSIYKISQKDSYQIESKLKFLLNN